MLTYFNGRKSVNSLWRNSILPCYSDYKVVNCIVKLNLNYDSCKQLDQQGRTDVGDKIRCSLGLSRLPSDAQSTSVKISIPF